MQQVLVLSIYAKENHHHPFLILPRIRIDGMKQITLSRQARDQRDPFEIDPEKRGHCRLNLRRPGGSQRRDRFHARHGLIPPQR